MLICKCYTKHSVKCLNIATYPLTKPSVCKAHEYLFLRKQIGSGITFPNLDKLYDGLKEHYNDDVKINDIDTIDLDIHTISDVFSFASNKIIEEIKTHNYIYEYDINFGDLTVKLYTISNVLTYETKMLKRLYSCYKFFKDNEKIHIDLYVFLTKQDKYFPPYTGKTVIFNNDMINSAQTMVNYNITVFRKEECVKTFTHELIHYFRLDSRANECELPHLNVDNNIDLREAFTEALACILNCIFVKIEGNESDINVLLEKERMFSIKQSVKILKLSNMTSYNDLLNRDSEKMIHESTNAVAYHIIKSSFLHKIGDFLKHTLETDILNKIDMVKEVNTNFCKICLVNDIFKNSIDNEMSHVNVDVVSTARMTIVE